MVINFRVVFVLTLRVEITAQTRPSYRVVPTLILRHRVSAVCRVARRVRPIWTYILTIYSSI
jgi:hypothetical protein